MKKPFPLSSLGVLRVARSQKERGGEEREEEMAGEVEAWEAEICLGLWEAFGEPNVTGFKVRPRFGPILPAITTAQLFFDTPIALFVFLPINLPSQ
jgi:hypothetical protein